MANRIGKKNQYIVSLVCLFRGFGRGKIAFGIYLYLLSVGTRGGSDRTGQWKTSFYGTNRDKVKKLPKSILSQVRLYAAKTTDILHREFLPPFFLCTHTHSISELSLSIPAAFLHYIVVVLCVTENINHGPKARELLGQPKGHHVNNGYSAEHFLRLKPNYFERHTLNGERRESRVINLARS